MSLLLSKIFDDFVSELPDKSSIVYAKVPHLCVSVFQEHPSMLLDEEKVHWRHVTDSDITNMIREFDTLFANMITPIRLCLQSILLTPDGAMIAGFEECSDDLGLFQELRRESIRIGKQRIGGLTSRPKNLIHVTLGRVLDIGQNTGFDVRKWNDDFLPKRMSKFPVPLEWTLEHVSLLRNKVWLCEENEIYATWSLST
jgi:hypothetical protein